MDERAVIHEVLRGHRQAYAELVRAHQATILRLCLSLLGNVTEAEDAAQEVFIKAYQSLASFRHTAAFSTWLYRIAANHCRDLLRRRVRRPTESLDRLLEEAGDAAEPLAASASDPRPATAHRDLIEQLLRRLSPDERLILTLREVQGLSYQELTQVLGCSLDAVKSRLRRARDTVLTLRDTFQAAETSKEVRRPT